eukprot:TRINITY_DN2726_c0_g1_i4.p1 TRINITY_DN2726_c0_g1~~TRINITY_DN2726_c0_g1_i4.p1  ORF type:complete len:165 (-),score=19.44 TRINITY_DN2726_c0_g1_i4:92-586(-)
MANAPLVEVPGSNPTKGSDDQGGTCETGNPSQSYVLDPILVQAPVSHHMVSEPVRAGRWLVPGRDNPKTNKNQHINDRTITSPQSLTAGPTRPDRAAQKCPKRRARSKIPQKNTISKIQQNNTRSRRQLEDEDTQAQGILEVTDSGVQQRSRRGGADAEWGRVM